VLSKPISLQDIREKIALFILSQIMDQKGEFHDPNKQDDEDLMNGIDELLLETGQFGSLYMP
jgi:hypothetical protein